jgi:cephalosporin hydroxylase
MHKLLAEEQRNEVVEVADVPQEAKDKYTFNPTSSDDGGVAILKRNVAGKVVKSIGHQTPIGALNILTQVVELVSQQDPSKPMRCIEVGSWVGESAIAIAAGLKHGGTVYCVESFEGDGSSDPINRAIATLGSDYIKGVFLSNTEGSPIRLIEGKSQDVAKNTEKSDADFVFIDAGHTYEDAKADIEAWWNHVAPNGWMCGDDYCEHYPGVVQAVNEFFVERNIPVKCIDGTDLWVVSKQEALECLKNQQK